MNLDMHKLLDMSNNFNLHANADQKEQMKKKFKDLDKVDTTHLLEDERLNLKT